MTMHLSGYEPAKRNSGGLAIIREDVHIHAGAPDIRALLADPTAYEPWLPEAVRDYRADSEGVAFTMQLPARAEQVSLRRVADPDLRQVMFRKDEGGPVERMSWGLHSEGARECHVTIELAYKPASGLLGGSMETLLHRGQRIQILRDLLWNLKSAIEVANGTSYAALADDERGDELDEAASA